MLNNLLTHVLLLSSSGVELFTYSITSCFVVVVVVINRSDGPDNITPTHSHSMPIYAPIKLFGEGFIYLTDKR